MKSKNPYEKALGNVIQDRDGKRPKRMIIDPDQGKEQKLRSGKVGNLGKVRKDMK